MTIAWNISLYELSTSLARFLCQKHVFACLYWTRNVLKHAVLRWSACCLVGDCDDYDTCMHARIATMDNTTAKKKLSSTCCQRCWTNLSRKDDSLKCSVWMKTPWFDPQMTEMVVTVLMVEPPKALLLVFLELLQRYMWACGDVTDLRREAVTLPERILSFHNLLIPCVLHGMVWLWLKN